MELITTRTKIRGVAARWACQYENDTGEFARKGAALAALDPETATAADVAAVTGSDGWTWILCNECGLYVDRAVQVGDDPDAESATAVVCRDCLVKALALLDAAE